MATSSKSSKVYARNKEGTVVKLGANAAAAMKDNISSGRGSTYTPVSSNSPDIEAQRTANRAAKGEIAPTSAGRSLEPATGELSYEQAAQNLQKGGLTGQTLTDAQTSLSKSYGVPGGPQAPVATPGAAPTPTQNKFQQGLATAQSSGIPVPQDPGQARAAATSYLPKETNTQAVDTMLTDDPMINSIMQNVATLLNPKNQTTTLMQDYKKLYKESGLKDINEELIDAETIIDGTEDDIRNEIQTAGGMATDSQVVAMGLSRNKSILKRYNQLVQMKSDATNQLNTMLSLNQQDKQMAQERLTTQINTMFQFANFRQQTINAARETAQWTAQTMGADGLYNSVAADPVQLARTEKILGLSPGGLQKIGAQAAEQKAFARRVDEEQLAIARGNLAVSQSNASATWANVGLARERFEYEKNAPKPQNAVQLQVQGYADRTAEADKTISLLGMKFTKPQSALSAFLPNFLKSSDKQQYEQSRRNFVNAVLRRESGAAIGKDEFDSASKQYFPQPGDTAETVALKSANRQTVINNLYDQAGAERGTLPGQLVQGGDGQTYIVGADGVTLTPQ